MAQKEARSAILLAWKLSSELDSARRNSSCRCAGDIANGGLVNVFGDDVGDLELNENRRDIAEPGALGDACNLRLKTTGSHVNTIHSFRM
jgi:hypothetical protein